MERDQKHLKMYKSSLFKVIQEVSSRYHSLNNTKQQFYTYLNHLTMNHLTRPAISTEKPSAALDHPDRKHIVKGSMTHKIFHFLFGESNNSTSTNKIFIF